VVHKNGSRELYCFEDASPEPTAVIELDDGQARLLAAVLNGSYLTD
jgi:K+/H+ antiporter YhaU regulatory subunit KhtT